MVSSHTRPAASQIESVVKILIKDRRMGIYLIYVDTVMWGSHQKLVMPCLTTCGNNLFNGSGGGGALTGRQTEPCSNVSQADVEQTETYILTSAVVFG